MQTSACLDAVLRTYVRRTYVLLARWIETPSYYYVSTYVEPDRLGIKKLSVKKAHSICLVTSKQTTFALLDWAHIRTHICLCNLCMHVASWFGCFLAYDRVRTWVCMHAFNSIASDSVFAGPTRPAGSLAPFEMIAFHLPECCCGWLCE